MKKVLRIGMLLCSFILASVGWALAQGDVGSAKNVINPDPTTVEGGVVNSTGGLLSARYLQDKCGTGSQESEISVFANGNEVKVYEENNTLYISTFDGNDVFGFTEKDSDGKFYAVRLYGGSYEANVEGGTKITLESGAIRNIYGGGRSDKSDQTANVSGTATINVTGGSFSLICGGGRYYAKTNTVAICIGTEQIPYNGTSNYIMAGGMDQGLTTNKDNKYNSSLTTNVNAVNTVTMDIYGGTFSVIGAGGGNGYTHTGVSTVNLTNVTVDKFYGVYSNGIADTVNVTISGSTINEEFATINRGKLINGTFKVDNSSQFGDAAKAYIGAAAGWSNSDSTGDPLPVVTGKIFYRLGGYNLSGIYLGEGLADATFEVRGKIKIAKFDRGSAFTEEDRYLTDFTISEKGNWKSTISMTFATGENAATLTNNGTLNAGVVDADHIDDLYALFEAGANELFLNGNPNAPYILPKQLVIKKPMTLYGNGATLQADQNATWPTENKEKDLISIQAGPQAEVDIKLLHVKNSLAAGINVQTAKKVTLTGVTSKDNATAGLLVHAPVEATKFHTAGNGWGGVNIDEGNNGSDPHDYNPSFTFNESCSFAEPNQIWSELATKNADAIVTLPEGNTTWRAIKGKNEEGTKEMWYWTNVSPEISVATAEALVNAVNSASDGDVILLGAGTYELSTPLVITKAITIKGDDSKSVIKAVESKESFTPYGTNDYNLITISGAGAGSVKLENLRITGSHGSGLNVQTAMKTYLDKVQLYDNANAGLLVHSEVEAQFLETEENGWGGVNIDKGTPEYTRKLTIKSNGYNFREKVKIWAEKANCPNPYETVIIEKQEDYYTYRWAVVEGKGGNNWDTDMIYWVTTDKPLDGGYTTIFVSENTTSVSNNITYYNANFYAYGNPVKVVAMDEHYTKIVNGNSDQDFIVLPYQNRASLYGGAKNGSVNSTSITMESGQLRNVYGGGYSPVGSTTISRANVLESATITLNEGAQVTNILQGGGYHYSKVPTVNISAINAKIGYLMVGGYDQGLTGNTIDTPLADSNNGVNTVNVNITGGEILVMGCGGGQGYSRTGTSTVTVNGTKIGSLFGTYSNGRADNINATFTDCTITDELAAINRGKIDNATFVFDGCSFGESIQSSVAAIGGWADSDINGKPVPTITNRVVWRFLNSKTAVPTMLVGRGTETTSIEVTGAPAVLNSFRDGAAVSGNTTAYSIGVGKTWIFNGGLSFDPDESQVTLTTNGTLIVPAVYVPALVSNANDGISVTLTDQEMAAVVNGMNSADNKTDLLGKSFSIECKDGVIASNKAYAAELAALGKLVKVLSFAENNYSLSDEVVQEAAKITNLPDSVAYGLQPITLAFNRTGFTATIEGTSDVASIENGVLTIKKPGEVTIKLTADNSGSPESEASSEAESYIQKLKVTKRIVTLTSGLEVNYGEGNTSKVYDGIKSITLTKGSLKFAGMLGGSDTKLDLEGTPTGELADANAGENKPVTVTATLIGDSAAFYELAPITFVKATITPKPITITAEDKSVYYGETVAYTVSDYSSNLVNDDKLDGTLKFSCAVKTDTTATVYPDAITPYGLTSPNYAITFTPGDLTVQALGPSIRIIDHKIVKEGATTNIVMSAQLINNGGAAVDKVIFAHQQGDVLTPVSVETELKEVYSFTYSNMDAGEYELYVKAYNTAGQGGSDFVKVTVDEKTPQNLTWDETVLSTMVYGQEMTLSASSDQTAASGEYIYSVSPWIGAAEFVRGTVIKATKVGEFTIGVERSGDENYSPASLETIVNVVQKPITVSVSGLEKVYDGTTTIGSPRFTLNGVEEGDDVSVNTNVTLSYASKNAGDNVAVILPELTLTGADAANYTLVQPTNVTGKITKAPLTIKVKDVTRPWNQRYTKYEFETTGLVNNETLAQAYSSNLKVTENGSSLELSIDDAMSQNYDISTQNGSLTITKGMPKAVVYGSETSGWNGMIVDYQGYDSNDLTLDNTNVAQGGKALVMLNGTVLTSSINSKPSTSSPSVNAASFSLRSASLRAGTEPSWNNTTFDEIEYGAAARTLTIGDFTYTSTNMSVLTVATDEANVTVTPVGVGNATIIAEKAGEVKIWNVTVTPKSLGMTATGMDKTYDGTATATGTVALNAGDIVGTDDVALDLSGITFNYEDKMAGASKPVTPSQPLVLMGTNANNYTLSGSLKGDIAQKTLTVKDPIAVYYNGQTAHTLTTYPATGLVAGDVAPITVTFADAAVGTSNITIALTSTGDAANYTLASSKPSTGTIQRSTLVATLPANASSTDNLKNNITLAIRETGEAVTANNVGFAPTITTSGSGANTVYSVTGGETTNYSVVYDRNQIGYAAPVIPGGGVTPDPEPEIPTVSNPVVAERTATTAVITWEKVSGATSYKLFLYAKKGDTTPLKTYEFDKDGNLKATGISFTLTELEDGKSYYVETIAYNAFGVELVKKSVELSATPTGIESIAEGSQLYTVKGAVVVVPAEPLQVAIYAVTGQTLFNDEVSYLTQVPAKAGIYVVVIKKGANTITEKIIVR